MCAESYQNIAAVDNIVTKIINVQFLVSLVIEMHIVYTCVAITLSKWDLMEQKRKEEEAAAARKQASYDDIDGRSVDVRYLMQNLVLFSIIS